MRAPFTAIEALAFMREIDTRFQNPKKYTDEFLINRVGNQGFYNVAAYGDIFADQEVVDLNEYITSGEENLVLQVEEDVRCIYQFAYSNQPIPKYDYISNKGELTVGGKLYAYADTQKNDIIHVRMNEGLVVEDGDTNNLVISYFYTPSWTAVYLPDGSLDITQYTPTIYMDAGALSVYKQGMTTAGYMMLKDDSQMKFHDDKLRLVVDKYASSYPEDFRYEARMNGFPAGI